MESSAGPMKRQQVAAAPSPDFTAPYINDDIVRNILVRLPGRSVVRFRSVCRAWRDITSTPEFIADHHDRQPTMPLVSFLNGGGGGKEAGPVDCCVEALDLGADDFRSVVRFTDSEQQCGRFHIHGSCDGLLLLSFDDSFYVCNPATRQWTRLPTPLSNSCFGGFYRHDPTNEYRALFYQGGWPGADYYILVADSRKGSGIGLPSEKGGYKFKGQPFGAAAFSHGHLYWMPPQKKDPKMLVFNTVTEVFDFRDPPLIREHMTLVAVDGELAMLSSGKQTTMVELWVLLDHKNEIWVLKHRIQLPAVKVSTLKFNEPWLVFYTSEEGVVIVTPEQKLLHYDMKGTLRESFSCKGRYLRISPFTFRESLIQHAFFQGQDNAGDDKDEQPPFFRWL